MRQTSVELIDNFAAQGAPGSAAASTGPNSQPPTPGPSPAQVLYSEMGFTIFVITHAVVFLNVTRCAIDKWTL